MTADADPTVASILDHARRVNLPLTPEEAERLVPGVRRMRAMAEAARQLLRPEIEPAGVFDATAAVREA